MCSSDLCIPFLTFSRRRPFDPDLARAACAGRALGFPGEGIGCLRIGDSGARVGGFVCVVHRAVDAPLGGDFGRDDRTRLDDLALLSDRDFVEGAETVARLHRTEVHVPGEDVDEFPDDAVAPMGLAALGEIPPPPRLPDDVVRYVFDGNARVYDENMAALAYAIPPVLTRMLGQQKGEPSASLDVLDLGCGSGLCGPLLRPFARRLVGVDLAPGMLALAAQRGAYDTLHEGEILSALTSGTLGMFDAVVAGNVVIYFGDLAPLAAAVAGVLRPAGTFLFDVERGSLADVAGFHTGGRYTHSQALVKRAFGVPAYERLIVEEAAMREEGGVPVPALCCAAIRSAL